MRSSCLLFVILIAVHVSDISAAESCPKENCVSSNQCETPWQGAECPNKEQHCCSIVKKEYRIACRHHGGECMRSCNKDLQRSVADCPADKVCCVLV